MRSRPFNTGFTLIELLIAVAIVGLLASIAIPNIREMRKRAKTTEARSNLGEIWILQEGYLAEFGTYVRPSEELAPGEYDGTTGWRELDFYPRGTTRYAYRILSANKTSFQARARGNIDSDSDFDMWRIDERGRLVHLEFD